MSTGDATTGCGESFIYDLRKGGKPMTTEEQKRVDRLERTMMNVVLMLGSESAQLSIRERCKEIIRDCDIPIPDPPAPEPSAFVEDFASSPDSICDERDAKWGWNKAIGRVITMPMAQRSFAALDRLREPPDDSPAGTTEPAPEPSAFEAASRMIYGVSNESIDWFAARREMFLAGQAYGETIGRKKGLEEAAKVSGSQPDGFYAEQRIQNLIDQEPDDGKG